jgi:uncharacterized protein (TIGR02145 family)
MKISPLPNPSLKTSMKIPGIYTSNSHLFIIWIGLALFLFIACEKEKMPFNQPAYKVETDSMSDVDGNVYRTVKIGDQWWMAENLRVGHYRNHVPVYYNQSQPDSAWSKLKKGAYCYLYNSYVPYNGMLYNWYVISDTNGIAPEGWRIPTDDDWKKLEWFIGMTADTANIIGWRGTHEGEKLKSAKTKNLAWRLDQSIQNTNESGFSALPGGCRLYNGSYGDSGQNSTGFWWTASDAGTDQAWFRYLDYHYAGIFRYYGPKVRLLLPA